MEKEKDLNFEEVLLMKEKRRSSRTKGKRTHEKTKIKSTKSKKRNVVKIDYDPAYDDEYYDEYEGY